MQHYLLNYTLCKLYVLRKKSNHLARIIQKADKSGSTPEHTEEPAVTGTPPPLSFPPTYIFHLLELYKPHGNQCSLFVFLYPNISIRFLCENDFVTCFRIIMEDNFFGLQVVGGVPDSSYRRSPRPDIQREQETPSGTVGSPAHRLFTLF